MPAPRPAALRLFHTFERRAQVHQQAVPGPRQCGASRHEYIISTRLRCDRENLAHSRFEAAAGPIALNRVPDLTAGGKAHTHLAVIAALALARRPPVLAP